MGPLLCGTVYLRELSLSDAPALATAYVENRAHLRPWEPVRPASFFTVDGQRHAVALCEAARSDGRGRYWVLVDDERIVGRVSLTDVVRGPFLSGVLGYWVAASHEGRGLAAAAVNRVCDTATHELGLHRLQAGTLVENVASQKVLEKCAFTRVGVAPQYLSINGQWQDHIMFQRILHN